MKEKSRHRFLWIPAVVLAAAIPALIALNLLKVSFPSWVMLIAVLALVAACAACWLRSGVKLWAKLVLSVMSAFAIVLGLFAAYCLPYWSSMNLRSDWEYSLDYDSVLTFEQAEKDMAQMRAVVRRCHPAFFGEEPEEFTAAYDASLRRLAQDSEITVNDLRREVQRTLSSLGDGHTNAYPNYDGQRYLKSIAGRKAEGWKLHSINSCTIDTLFKSRYNLFCYEAESWGELSLRDNLSSLSGLDFLGIDPEGVTFTWVNEEGEFVTDTHTAADFLTMDEYLEYNAQYSAENQPPEQFVCYDYETELYSQVTLLLTECRYDEEYKEYLQLMFTDVKENGIKNVIVDLRGNGGGNSMVANEFIRYLPVDTYKVDGYYYRFGCFMLDFTKQTTVQNDKYTDLTFDGNVYLLTDSGSFSSAMLFAAYIKDNDLGTIIGEPPGNDPNGYGDVANFRLDNSGLYMSVSTKRFVRPDQECTDHWVMPDVECDGDKAQDVLCDLLGE